jgi:hypothetical protein
LWVQWMYQQNGSLICVCVFVTIQLLVFFLEEEIRTEVGLYYVLYWSTV